jgi:hypothetical protein
MIRGIPNIMVARTHSPVMIWDISTASYDGISYDPSLPAGFAQGIYLRADGIKLYIVNDAGKVYQYTLGTAFNISTATYDTVTFDASAQVINSSGLWFSADGKKLYLADQITNQKFYQYPLSTAWDLSTAGASTGEFAHGEYTIQFLMSPDGTRLISNIYSTINYYTMSVPFDITTLTYVSQQSFSGDDPDSFAVWMSGDGKKLYHGGALETIWQYSLSTPWDSSTESYDSKLKDVSAQVLTIINFIIVGSKLYVLRASGADDIFQYSITE